MAGKTPSATFFSAVPSRLAIQIASLRSKAMRRSAALAIAAPETSRANKGGQSFIAVTLRFWSRQRQCDEERCQKCNEKDHEINKSAEEEFENRKEPVLPINAADRQENQDRESQPEKSNNPAG